MSGRQTPSPPIYIDTCTAIVYRFYVYTSGRRSLCPATNSAIFHVTESRVLVLTCWCQAAAHERISVRLPNSIHCVPSTSTTVQLQNGTITTPMGPLQPHCILVSTSIDTEAGFIRDPIHSAPCKAKRRQWTLPPPTGNALILRRQRGLAHLNLRCLGGNEAKNKAYHQFQ